MSENRDTTIVVADQLNSNPDGVTVGKLAELTGLSQRNVGDVLRSMETDGTAVRTPGANGRKGNELWQPVSTPTDDDTIVDDEVDQYEDDVDDVDDEPIDDESESESSTNEADQLKVLMIGTLLGARPKGITAADIVDKSGLRTQIVSRLLGAMEIAGAAVRRSHGDDKVELWTRGPADLSLVDLSNVTVREVCPHCHRPMPRRSNTVRITRTATGRAELGKNSDGQTKLGKGGLQEIVRDFIQAHPGHEFTSRTISQEIGRSSGAIGNALDRLVGSGEAVLVCQSPLKYSATPVTR